MKMKRTLAGVAAGLVAVSAMATAVSADQETINLHYDLRTKIETIDNGTVTIIQTYQNSGDNLFTIPVNCPLTFGFNSDKLGKLVEARADFTGVEFIEDSRGNLNTRDFTESLYYADKDRVVDDFRAIVFEKSDSTAMIDTTNDGVKDHPIVNGKVLQVPVKYAISETTTNTSAGTPTTATQVGTVNVEYYDVFVHVAGSTTAVPQRIQIQASSSVTDQVTAVDALQDFGYTKSSNEEIINGVNYPVFYKDGVTYWAECPAPSHTESVPVWDVTQGTSGSTSTSTEIVPDPHGHKINSLNGTNFQRVLDANNSPVLDTNYYHFKKITVALTYEVPSKYRGELNYSNWPNPTVGNDSGWLRYFGLDAIGWTDQKLENLRNGITAVMPAGISGTTGTISFGALSTKPLETHYFPLMTTTAVKSYGSMYPLLEDDHWCQQYDGGTWSNGVAKNSKNITTNDVIAAIRRSGSGTSPLSVLNDAIANDLDVQFTFTSASGNVATAMSHARLKWVKFGQTYEGYDPGSCWSKTAFGQHLYSNSYSDVSSPYTGASFTPAYTYNAAGSTDMYGSYSSAWAQNLISAGLVVNSELTMQLNDTKKLVWNENQLTFNWFDVTDETKITRANQILTTMLLYTPVDWYWDSLDVSVIEPEEEEDVNAGEGIEEDGEVLDEEIEEEEVEEEEVEEEEEDWEEEEEVEEETEPEIEEVEVEETEAEVVEVAPVASPKTGNSPIALAVIPVALAAAAVVAKKRG